MAICAVIKNNDVNFMAMGQSYINNISEKGRLEKTMNSTILVL